MSKVLVVAAHPDDETLGCGGTIAKHIAQGDQVFCLIMAGNHRSPDITDYFISAMEVLGLVNYKLLGLPDMELEKSTLWSLAQSIENFIREIGVPDIIYTHSSRELSQDHRITAEAVAIAMRPVWGKPFSIYAFDSPSSTEWSDRPFNATMFVDISKYMYKKIKAIQCYTTETASPPHPRSEPSIRARSVYWGSHCGLTCVEAFTVIREVR